jgi:hypothetical protein
MKLNKETTALPESPPPDRSSARIFISYAREDGARFATELCEKFLGRQLSVWLDIVSLDRMRLAGTFPNACRSAGKLAP